MEEAFRNDIYSRNFNVLKKLGLWHYDGDNPTKKRLYLAFGWFTVLWGATGNFLALVQLYLSRRDFHKVSFNLSTTVLSLGILIKNVHVWHHAESIDRLRHGLFVEASKQTEEEDVRIKDRFKRNFSLLRKTFALSVFTCLPIWLSTSLFSLKWGPREMPYSLWFPLNLNDDRQYALSFILFSLLGTFVSVESYNGELGFFSLIFQMSAQYKVLAKDVLRMNDRLIPTSGKPGKIDSDRFSTGNRKIRDFLKKFVRRQLELNECVKQVEVFYNKPMLLQLACCLTLCVVNGVEVLGELPNVSMKWFNQIGYTLIITGDIFYICFLANLLLEQKRELSIALYSVSWYEMDPKIQKDFLLILMGSQIHQPLTAWKMFQLDLNTFLGVLKAIGSWLTLFWQLIQK